MQPAFEIAEQHGDGLDALLVGEIFQALFLDFVGSDAVLALLFGLQIQLFQFVIGNARKLRSSFDMDLLYGKVGHQLWGIVGKQVIHYR